MAMVSDLSSFQVVLRLLAPASGVMAFYPGMYAAQTC